MKYATLVLLFFYCGIAHAQNATITGKVLDESGNGLGMTTVALLYPNDSTVAYFGLSDESGEFKIPQVLPANYLLNLNQYGFEVYLNPITLDEKGLNVGLIILKPLPTELEGVDVIGERSPMLFKKDTIEYNAAAFRTNPDAPVEDLFQKLPGIEVDAAGNIKAQGNSVNKIMVDGKEFFSNDPKVVSKNLPADAVKKVQVFDEKSDDEVFTGTNDGHQSTTINLVLKEDRKKLWFGNATAGGGTNKRFLSSLKAFNFAPDKQFAFIGMANNVNQFGFTMDDYIDYSGGIQQFMNGNGNVEINASDVPIDFGQPIYGNIHSGIGALNYTLCKTKGKSTNFTYMGTGQNKQLKEATDKQNYLSNGTVFSKLFSEDEQQSGSHKIGFSRFNKSDSTFQFRLSGGMSLATGKGDVYSRSNDTLNNMLISKYESSVTDRYNELKGNLAVSYSRKWHKNTLADIFKTGLNGSFSGRVSDMNWINNSQFYTTNFSENEEQLLEKRLQNTTIDLYASSIKRLRNGWFFEAGMKASTENAQENRNQQEWFAAYQVVDSLSGAFVKQGWSVIPEIALRKSTDKVSMSVNLGSQNGVLTTLLSGKNERTETSYSFLLPQLNIVYSFKQSNRLSFNARSETQLPQLYQLNPIVSNVSRMQLTQGNPMLKPAYVHQANLSWFFFDNFSFVSIFADAQLAFTQNKISISRHILQDYSQKVTYVNVAEDWMARGLIDFSIPIRKLKITSHLRSNETYNKGISLVNDIATSTITLGHDYELSIENRKKTNWDVSIGARYNITTTHFTLQSELDNRFRKVGLFGTIDYTLLKRWNFEVKADLTNYSTNGSSNSTFVPLISTTISYYFMKNNRATLALTLFDLLNRNTGIQQIAQLNYFQTTRSTMLSQYALLKFSYKLKSR